MNYGFSDPYPSLIELNNREISLRTAEEGIVLLKNESILPLKNQKIALYGIGSRHTFSCGIGSGGFESRHDANIEEGLINCGFEITTTQWLNDYNTEYSISIQQYKNLIKKKIGETTNSSKISGILRQNPYKYPSGRIITEKDVRDSNTDTSIFVLSRQAGEGKNRAFEKGDYYIDDNEFALLKSIEHSYQKVILVINSGCIIDFSFLEEFKGINAALFFGQAGEEGGNALGNLLSGKKNFSGKMSDSIPYRYEDIPFGLEYGKLNGNVFNECYKEGIYVGYRYFDSFKVDVRFPFGFGLSYTTFSMKTVIIDLSRDKIILKELVTNIGEFEGKEVVQVYVSVPGENKEFQRLVQFAKTGIIKPRESELIDIEFDFKDCSSYDVKNSQWKLYSGTYLIRVGNCSRSTTVIGKIQLPSTIIVSQCKNCLNDSETLKELVNNNINSSNEEIPNDVPVIAIDSASFLTEEFDYNSIKQTESEEEKSILDQLTVEEQIEFLVGDSNRQQLKDSFQILSTIGKTTMKLIPKGIRNIIMADGPAGIKLQNEVCYKDEFTSVAAKLPPVPITEKFYESHHQECSTDGTIVYRYTTLWPSENVLAQTWNKKMLEEIGAGISHEMSKYGVSVFLGPSINIHRNPLCGRNFEYFSEDPVLTGELARHLIIGVQFTSGHKSAVALKHFCCNNSEDFRRRSSSNLSERTLREIYLRGFEIAVRKSRPKSIMSSYNMVNHKYTAESKELLTDILRCEWKFDGVVMTDWGSCKLKEANPAS